MSDYKGMGRSRLIAEIEALSHWRDFALQFDNHRMEALWHLKRVLADENQTEQAEAFLSKPPLSAGDIVSERDQLKAENESLRADAERYRVLRRADIDTIHNGGLFVGLTPENVVINGCDLDYRCDALISSPENH